MASDRQSPVMVEQSSPTHTFSSPDFALSILSPSFSSQRISTPTSSSSLPASEPHRQRESPQATHTNQEHETHLQGTDNSHTPEHDDGGDDSSHSDSASNSSASTETPHTVSTPVSAEQDSGNHPSSPDAVQPPEPPTPETEQTTQDPTPPSADTTEHQPQTSTESPAETAEPPVQPPEDVQPVVEDIPEWVKYEEDTSTPTEEELKEIESSKSELDASDFAAIEKDVFTDIDDPELRPHKKVRLSWVIKGVRGTREKPNRARIMMSPAVQIDGLYWNIKFFPRGNKSRTSLSAYLRCSRDPPESNEGEYEGTFKAFEAAPDTDFSKCDPTFSLDVHPPKPKSDDHASTDAESTTDKKEDDDSDQPRPQDDQDNSASDDEHGDADSIAKMASSDEDFRVSAQLGLAVYNPNEPRTCSTRSASHQFYPHQDDWGWDTAVSHWEEIHRRKSGQRQALLRNDTLAIDAYIRMYNDPTKALFWHSSSGETQWDAKGLAGYFPLGTRMLYHSPATAGIAAWTCLAPFRSLIQGIDAGAWRKDSATRPRSLVAQLQLALFQMRHMKKEELYVHIDNVISELTRCQESFDNVATFWEAFRRSIELEVKEDPAICGPLSKMFGVRGASQKLPLLPVENVANFQEGVNQGFAKAEFKGPLPDFLPLTLQRQSFDLNKREWRLHRDKVSISEEIDMSRFCTDEDSKYTLYGLVVHEAERTSGKFHSILRPTGPGGKWLSFTDGNGNKIKSYTKKQVEEYELPDDSAVKNSNEAPRMFYMGLYIRTSQLANYLPNELEPFRLPAWLKPFLEEPYNHNPDHFEPAENAEDSSPVQIELFWDKLVGGQEGKLDLYRLKSNDKARQKNYRQVFTVDRDATILDVKAKLASTLCIPEKAFKLWSMNYYRLGAVSKAYMYVLSYDSVISTCLGSLQVLNLWLSVLPDKHDLADDVLEKNFLNLESVHVEAPPKPEPVKITEGDSSTSATSNADDQPSSSSDAVVQAENSTQSETSPNEESHQDIQTTAQTQPPEPSSANNQSSSNRPNDEEAVTLVAAPDAEQASVHEAVQQSLQDLSSESRDLVDGHTSTQNQNVESTTSPTDTHTTTESQPLLIAAHVHTAASPTDDQSASLHLTGLTTGGTSSAANPGSTTASTAETTTAQNENNSLNATTNDTPIDETFLPVVHGHLVDAASHEDVQQAIVIPISIGNEQIIIVPSVHEDLSEADAALISQMIAEDLEASEQQATREDGQDEDGESAAEEEGTESRPSTPQPVVADIYGFLHVFDAGEQKFTAKCTFNVPRDTVISSMIKKQLGFDENHAFQLWKRDGTFRTTGVSLESSFIDVSSSDCCEVIVGDHIGEAKIVALKAEAKFVDPGQLMRHIAMVQRKHPVLAATTEGAVEISEFGGDYYKGALVNGQRHGKQSFVVTQSGDTYDGPLLSGHKSGGRGKMTYQNGDVYDGEWVDDQKHGQGEFIEKRTGNRYVGGYENDRRWGKGVTYWEMADQQAALCQVCYFEDVDAVFYKCGHVVACYTCAKQCASDSAGCPVCRKPVEAVVKMFRS